MPQLWFLLNDRSKVNLLKVALRLGMFELSLPDSYGLTEVKGKLESLEEIDEIMRKAPEYAKKYAKRD